MNQSYLEKIPIRLADLNEPTEKARYNKIISYVDQMQTLSAKIVNSKTDHEKITIQRQIEAVDAQIDQLVYELYGLTEPERAIVDASRISRICST